MKSIKDAQSFKSWKALLKAHEKEEEEQKKKYAKRKNQTQAKKKDPFAEMMTQLLAIQCQHFPILKSTPLFKTLHGENSSLVEAMSRLSLQTRTDTEEEKKRETSNTADVPFDLLEYLLSLYPYGVAISGISSLVQYRLDKLKDPTLVKHTAHLDKWTQELVSSLKPKPKRSNDDTSDGENNKHDKDKGKDKDKEKEKQNGNDDSLLLSKCRVIDNMFILPLQSTATVYKINCNEQTAISGSYVLHSPLVCQHPHAKADRLQECVDLYACTGGMYVEYVNYHPLWPLDTMKASEKIVIEGPILRPTDDDKHKDSHVVSWQINRVAELNNDHVIVQHFKSYPFLFTHHLKKEEDSERQRHCIDPEMTAIDFKVGDNVYAYMKDDHVDDLHYYNEHDLAVVNQCAKKELLISGRITNVDILKTNGGTFLVELGECEHYVDPNGIQPPHVGIIWLKSVHLNEVKFMKEYSETLFNAADAITIHVKGFGHGIHYEEKDIEEHVTTVLKIVDKIVKDEISARQNANEKLKTFSVFFAFDGDAFANRSFTALLPLLYTRVCTSFPSQVRSIQLLAFLKNEDCIRFERDWRDVTFISNPRESRRDNVKIWCVLTNCQEWHELGTFGMTCTNSKHVLCFGGGPVLKTEYLNLAKHKMSGKNSSTQQKVIFHAFNVHRYKYSVDGATLERESPALLLLKNDDNDTVVNKDLLEIKKYTSPPVINREVLS
ncbi:hypothetical protein RFI_09532 [Reticulomyxa filosa]|uniref:Uncharacterized protein n=1 Tax=Reticulomyxa filosa TaxID=46433 RepID=X6NMV8_RETFI|nr:hypothetical protein RFI_09532 [Reticulomyxa filosa]|eukprot:ETO27600.1 hypothetical protein RFI_09532 [Reticulomyxa filosa]